MRQLSASRFISSSQECVPNESVAMCTQLRIADNSRFDEKIGTLSQTKFREIERATQVTLDMI
jgi:mRNA-degrading endonuclease toxin of MazEF toxin-antitoxin module